MDQGQASGSASSNGHHSPVFVSKETLDAACARIALLEDLVREIAALDDGFLLGSYLNSYRATIREWRSDARSLME